ncbi:hypothetical protein NLU13_5272 [Sarocladium strictum]|uniref:Gag1-like clamp domain-containing protein n=1 Tax=Sarocladium strictum TaxID=5046 RepID=A0AA39L7Q8_SARSR|nr:hypothetical protein NLU13_5272 [Sarocladium strictum]
MIFSDIYKGPRSPLAKLRHQSLPAATNTAEMGSIPSANDDTARPDWINDEYADLLSRDKVRQKEAVKRYLSAKVRNDWVFTWPPASLDDAAPVAKPADVPDVAKPETIDLHAQNGERPETESQIFDAPAVAPPVTRDDAFETACGPVQDEVKDDDGYHVDDTADDEDRLSVQSGEDETDNISIYSIVSEDPLHYRPRMDWTSDLSDSETISFSTPFRFNSPEDVGPEVQAAMEERKAKQRREAREEAKWNEGFACYEARRNAWTGARTVRIKSKPVAHSTSPRSGRRFFFRRSISSSPPAASTPMAMGTMGSQTHSAAETSDASSSANNDGDKLHPLRTKDSTASASGPETAYPVQTLIPLAPPILPPENCLRASINPSVYINLYEKVILSSLQPSCPINLSDMIRSCVVGWQRDGEWPPRAIVPITTAAAAAAAAAAAQRKRQQKAAKRLSNAGASDGTGAASNVARRMSFGLLGSGGGGVKEKDETDGSRAGKGFRRSLQKALGIGTLPVQGNEGTAVR